MANLRTPVDSGKVKTSARVSSIPKTSEPFPGRTADETGNGSASVPAPDHPRSFSHVILGKNVAVNVSVRLAREAMGMLTLKAAYAGLAFFISLLLARLMGTVGYGAYAYAISWATLLSGLAMLGTDKLLVRNLAAYRARLAWPMMRGLLRRANQAVLLASLGLAPLSAIILLASGWRFQSGMLTAVVASAALLPLIALTRLRRSAIQGLNRVVIAHLPEMLIWPLSLIALIGVIYFLFGQGLTANWAVAMCALAMAIAFVSGEWLLAKALPAGIKQAPPVFQTRAWAGSALPLLFLGGMHIINSETDVIMLGAMKGAEAAGVFSIAIRGAGLITFVLLAVNAALAPTIASLYATGQIRPLQRVITQSTRATVLLSLGIAIGLILFGHWFLLLFGFGFTGGQGALAILSIGNLVRAGVASAGVLLIMTGHERDAAIGIGISAVLNIVLNAILIPQWGLEGAALATAGTTVLWSVLMAFLVYKRLGIDSTAFGKLSRGEGPRGSQISGAEVRSYFGE